MSLKQRNNSACGTAFAVVVGTLLGPPPPVVTGRHPDLPVRKTARRTTTPGYAGLRAVHAPGVTPVLGPRSTAAASSRAETRARLVAGAMLNEKAPDEFTRTLQETPRIGHDHAVGIPGEHTHVALGLLAGAVGLLLLGKVVHKVVGRIGVAMNGQSAAGTGGSGATMATLEENRADLERIFQNY